MLMIETTDKSSERFLKRRPPRAALFILVILVITLGYFIFSVSSDWRQTQLREAYLPQLATMAQRHPDNGQVQAVLGARLMQAGQYAAAADALKAAIASGENSTVIWLALAGANAASGQPGRAMADLHLGLQAQGHSPQLQAVLAQAQALGPGASPLELAETINPVGPQKLLSTYAQGSWLNGLVSWWGQHHAAASGFETRRQWAADQPHNPQAVRLWGMALLENQRVPEALAVEQHALALAPQSADVHFDLAEALSQFGDPADASLQYMASLRLHPRWLPALLGLGNAEMQNGILSFADDAFREATHVAPRSAAAWIGLGTVETQGDGKAAEAVASFQHASSLAPQRIDFLDAYADALSRDNHWNASETMLRKRIQAVPNDSYAHYLLGRVLMDNNPTPPLLENAEEETNTALRLLPQNPLAEEQLGEIKLDRGHPQSAINLIQAALQQRPYDESMMVLLARADQEVGKTSLSAKVSQQAAALLQKQQRVLDLETQEQTQPFNITLHRQLAQLYQLTGKDKNSLREYGIVQMLQTNPQQAKQQIQAFDHSLHAALPDIPAPVSH